MTLLPHCAVCVARALVLCGLVTWFATALRRTLEGASRELQLSIWGMLAVLLATPDLMVGYAYGDFEFSLAQSPTWNELLYATLVGAKLLPLATLLAWFSPPSPLSPSASHCLRLARVSVRQKLDAWLQGTGRRAGPIAAVVFLLAFQDFELAARLGVVSWTVRLFDLHAREGFPLEDSLWLTLIPAAITLAVALGAVFPLLAGLRNEPSSSAPQRTALRRFANWPFLLLIGLLGLASLIPVAIVYRGTWGAWMPLLRDPAIRMQLLRETSTTLLVGSSGAVLAMLLSRWLNSRAGLILCLPGMLGSLVLGLVSRGLFRQIDIFSAHVGLPLELYDTPLPLVCTLTLWLLPRAVLLRWALRGRERQSSVAVAELLRSAVDPEQRAAERRLQWDLLWRGRYWAAVLLTGWAYWDLTLPSLLAPTGMTAAPVRLYNFMHFRQTTILSAQLVVTILAPLAIVGLLAGLAPRLMARRSTR